MWHDLILTVSLRQLQETLYDTAGITYQMLQKKNQWIKNLVTMRIYRLRKKHVTEITEPTQEIPRKDKRRQAYQSRSLDIFPYRKKIETKDLRFPF